MCFSAGASFGAAAVLGTAGVITINKVKSSSQLMFASMPLLFALQQVAEGFIWLSFSHPQFNIYRYSMVYVFLFFAQVLWPGFLPLAVWSMESDQKRRRILGFMVVLGLFTSVLLAYRLIRYPVAASIVGHHIRYDITSPGWIIPLSGVLYMISTIGAPLSSTLKYMKSMGVIIFMAFVVTEIFFRYYLISVWCFFAAVLSITIFFVIRYSTFDRSQIHSILGNHINPEKLDW